MTYLVKPLLVLASLALVNAQMIYHGGPVLVTGPKLYTIHYGDWLEADKAVPRGFLANLSGSSWLGHATGYYDYTQTHVQNLVRPSGEVTDPLSQGSYLCGTTEVAVVQRAIDTKAFPLDPTGIYLILGAPGVNDCYNPHHWGIYLCEAGTPRPCVGGIPTQSLWASSSLPFPGTSSGQSIIPSLSHELIEAITDPRGGDGWVSSSGYECADLCGTYSSTLLGGITYRTADYLGANGGCNSTGSSGGGTPPPPPPPPNCPPGTTPRGNSGKCK